MVPTDPASLALHNKLEEKNSGFFSLEIFADFLGIKVCGFFCSSFSLLSQFIIHLFKGKHFNFEKKTDDNIHRQQEKCTNEAGVQWA